MKSTKPQTQKRRRDSSRVIHAVRATGSRLPKADHRQLESRLTTGVSRDYHFLTDIIEPQQIRWLMYASMQGDFNQAYNLFSLMQDTSPRLLFNLHEMRENASQISLKAVPFARRDKDPTPEAKEKAEHIEWALDQFRPEEGTDETDLAGTTYDILASLIMPSMTEIMYHRKDGLWAPRAGGWVIPRKYGFDADDRLGITPEGAATFGGAMSASPVAPQKFIVANYKSRSGAITMSGLTRPLSFWWSAGMLGRKWLIQFAERFGNAIPIIPYSPDIKPEDKAALEAFAANFAANAYLLYPDYGQKPELFESKRDPKDLPTTWLLNQYDYYCDLLILGEQRMSEIGRTTGSGGGYAQAAAQKTVKNDRVRAIANFGAAVLTNTLVRWLLWLNYGNDDEAPTLQADFTETQDPLQQSQMIATYKTAGYELDEPDLREETGLPLKKVKVEAPPPGGPTPQEPGARIQNPEEDGKATNRTNGTGSRKDAKTQSEGDEETLNAQHSTLNRLQFDFSDDGKLKSVVTSPESPALRDSVSSVVQSDSPADTKLDATTVQQFREAMLSDLEPLRKAGEPLAKRIQTLLAIHDDALFKQELSAIGPQLSALKDQLPELLRAINHKPQSADVLADGMAAKFFNTLAIGKSEIQNPKSEIQTPQEVKS